MTFRHFASRAVGKVTPASAIASANEIFRPSMYATRIPGRSASEKTPRNSVAPVATTREGLTVGAVTGTRARSRLVNAVWPAATKNAPPMVWKTGESY